VVDSQRMERLWVVTLAQQVRRAVIWVGVPAALISVPLSWHYLHSAPYFSPGGFVTFMVLFAVYSLLVCAPALGVLSWAIIRLLHWVLVTRSAGATRGPG
jgi:hypothetical protein